MAPGKHFEVERHNDVTVIRFLESKLFDHVLLTELQDELFAYIEAESPTKLLIDFSEVEFCSTSLINSLLRIRKMMMGNGGKLRLSGMRTNVREAFQMLNLDGPVFEIFATAQDASWK